MADVQLGSTESFHSYKRQQKTRLKEIVAKHASDKGVVLVKVDDIPLEPDSNGSLLTERQKEWLSSAPYNSSIQNPVLYKYRKESRGRPSQDVREAMEARKEVQNLYDEPVTQPPSGIVDKIERSRKERHERLIIDMEEELALICSEFELPIRKASELLQSQLKANDEEVEALFASFSSNEVLLGLCLSDLNQLWEKLSQQVIKTRGKHIQELDRILQDVEVERAQKIEKTLQCYAEQLKVISHLLPSDVDRLVEEEGLMVTMEILANRRSYVELCTHLRTADCIYENQQRKRWEALVESWKEALCRDAFQKFSKFMQSEEVLEPREMVELRSRMKQEQQEAGTKCRVLLHKVLDLKPPLVNTAQVYEWREEMDQFYLDLDNLHSSCLLQFQECLSNTHRKCEEEMEKLRNYLVDVEALGSYAAYELMCRDFIPFVDQYSERHRGEVQAMEKALDAVLSAQKEQIAELFQFVQGAALLWDDQRTAIEQIWRDFQEKLESVRGSHDMENQNLEANLDVVLDRLRQGATKDNLDQYLSEALKMLDTIKGGYSSFQESVMVEIRKFPSLFESDLDFYDAALCQHLSATRQTTVKAGRSKSRPQISLTPSKKTKKESVSPSKGSKSKQALPATVKVSITVGGGGAGGSSTGAGAVGGAGGSGGSGGGDDGEQQAGAEVETLVYLLPDPEENETRGSKGGGGGGGGGGTGRKKRGKLGGGGGRGGGGGGTFMTQDEDQESSATAAVTENIVLFPIVFSQLKHNVRVNFLQHLEEWKRECVKNASEAVAEKEEEAQTELELRLHLHVPRPSRVTEDIYNIRDAELTVHRERMGRHAKGVVSSLQGQKECLPTLDEKLNAQVESLKSALNTLDFSSASNVRGLKKVMTEAGNILRLHMTAIKDMVTQHEEASRSLLLQLSTSNSTYRDSLKTFQEGGNYCPEEVDIFTKKIDKIDSKIAATTTLVGRELTHLLTNAEQAGTQAMDIFKEQYSNHHAELHFAEVVSQGLVSIQVSIKSEVAASNSQAKQVSADIEKLRTLLASAKNKDSLPTDVLPHLLALASSVSNRCNYLHCWHSKASAEVTREETTLSPHPHRVSFEEEREHQKTPLSAVNVSKAILEHASGKKSSTDHSGAGGQGKATGKKKKNVDIIDTTSSTDSHSKSTPIKKAMPSRTVVHHEDSDSHTGTPTHTLSYSRHRRRLTKTDLFLGVEGGDSLSSFLPKVRMMLTKKYFQLMSVAEDFYCSNSHPVSTPAHLKDLGGTIESFTETLEDKVQAYRSQVEEYRRDCIEELLGQVEHVTTLAVQLARLVCEEVATRHQTTLVEKWEAAGRDLNTKLKESRAKKCHHESSLQSSLGHPGRSEELAELCSREEERHRACLAVIRSHTQLMAEEWEKHADEFVLDLLRTVKNLLKAMDTVTYSFEISGARAVIDKPSINQLLRKHVAETTLPTTATVIPSTIKSPSINISKSDNCEEARGRLTTAGSTASSDVASITPLSSATIRPKKIKARMASGRQFQWPQILQKQLSVFSSPLRKGSQMVAFSEVAKAKVMSKKTSLAHEEVIRSRDLVFEEYLLVYKKMEKEIQRIEKAEEDKELKWIQNWRTSLENMKQLYTS